jgi:hypothetical protein
MNFSGRSDLVALVDQLVQVRGGPQVAPDTVRPVLVLEGCGGSGRSELLRHVWGQWAARTPTVAVDPLAVSDGDPGSMRDVLLAAMLGLTADVPGYKISFPRVVLAHVAMAQAVRAADPDQRVAAMRERLNTYRDRGAAVDLVGDLVAAAGGYVRVPGVEVVAPAVARSAAQEIVRRLNRAGWRASLAWKDALDWFRHQDQGFHHDPVRALVQLSVQAQSENTAVRLDVDHLLMAALLADLRDSVARAVGHPWNAVVLLDNGDTPAATEFVRALVGVRQELARAQVPPDPLTVVTVSGGPLTAALAGPDGEPPRWTESALPELTAEDVRRAGPWLSVLLGDLGVDDMQQLARAGVWPNWLGTSVVAQAVHRLTSGHAAATSLVLDAVQATPQLVDDLDGVLRRPGPAPGRTLERYLLDRIVAGLSPQRHVDPHLREDLVTLAAARDKAEAQQLASLLDTPVDAEPVLFTSTTLWSAPGPRGHPALAPFARYLLLRALAARPAGHRAGWRPVFAQLRECAAARPDDLGGRLHHELALGLLPAVAGELDRLLPGTHADHWLALLDQAVGTPDLGPPAPAGDGAEPDGSPAAGWPEDAGSAGVPSAAAAGSAGAPGRRGRSPKQPTERRTCVTQLVSSLHALADPRLSDRDRLRRLYLIVSHDYRQLANTSLEGLTLFLARAQQYQKLADALA